MRISKFLMSLLGIGCLFLWNSFVYADEPISSKAILSSSTESPVHGGQTPSASAIKAILNSANKSDLDSLKECAGNHAVHKNSYERFFTSVKLPALSAGQAFYFVRPALKPYCSAFYGAHSFQYWLVVRSEQASHDVYIIRYAGTADEMTILSSVNNGSYDVAEISCGATICLTIKMKFNGQQYTPSECHDTHDQESGAEVQTSIPCPSH